MRKYKLGIMVGFFIWSTIVAGLSIEVMGIVLGMSFYYMVMVPILFPTYLRMLGTPEERIRVLFGEWL